MFLVYLHAARFHFLPNVVFGNVPAIRIVPITTLEGRRLLFEMGGVVLRSEESHYNGEGRNASKKHSITIQIRKEKWARRERGSDVPLNFGIIGDILSLEYRTEMFSPSYIREFYS